MSSEQFRAIIERLAPGTALRRAVGRIIQQQNGALVVLGDGPEVDRICSGGFKLVDADFSPARLAELAKMDGATVLDDDWRQILAVNVHLLPDPSLKTSETGARHRTAERVAKQTGKPVLAVSEDRRVATLFLGERKQELQDPTALTAAVNQALLTLERFRRRLDEAVERLTPMEVADRMTYRHVVIIVQRAELVRRIGAEIEDDTSGLGGQGALVRLQLADLLQGVVELRDLVVRDYVRPLRAGTAERRLAKLEAVPTSAVSDPEVVAEALGFAVLDDPAEPLGLRVLTQVPRLPESVRERLAKQFRSFQKMLRADVSQLASVSGIGQTRAQELRSFFDRLEQSVGIWEHDEL